MERLQVILMLVADQYKREANEAAAATTKIGTAATTTAGTTQSATSGMARSLGGLSTAAKVGIAGAAVGALAALGKASVDAASNLEESMNAVRVQFGDAAEGINDLGERSVTSFGLSQRAFNEFAVRFSAFAENIASSSGRSVVDVVEEMTTRVADFASVMNLDMEEAARVIQSALAGETEAFRRFGGDVSAAAVQLKAAELGLGDTSAELTEQEKILARYQLIMEQTEKTAGDFANTSDSLANQQRILSGNVEDLQAKIGALLVPAVAEAVDVLNDLLTIGNGLADLFSGTGEGGFLGGLIGSLDDALSMLTPFGTAARIAGDWLDVLSNHFADDATAAGDWSVAIGTGTEVLDQYNQMAGQVPVVIDAATISMGTGTEVLDAYNEMAREGGAAWRENTTSIEDNIAALDAHQDAMRAQTDPLFALLEATRGHADAQVAANEALEKFGKDSPEYEDALADLAAAGFDLRDAQAQARVATNLTKDAFINQATQAGLARDQAQQLADVLYGLEGLRLDPIQLTVEIRELRRAAGSQAGGVQEYHTGGVVAGDFPGQEVLIKALVGETVIPRGHSAPVAAAAGTVGGGGVHIDSVYAMGTPASIAHDIGQEVALELRMAR